MQSPSVVSFVRSRAGYGKGIVYVQTIGDAEDFAKALGCEAYFRDQVDKGGSSIVSERGESQ